MLDTAILVLAALGAFFMAFNNGANDVANAFASAVGSRAVTIRQALVIAAIMNFLGALLLGSHVASYLIEGVVNPTLFDDPHLYVLGMLASLIATGVFVLFSSLSGMPVSSTHAIVGSLTGISIVLFGFDSVNWVAIMGIGASWVLSPFLAGFLSLSAVRIIRRNVYKLSRKTGESPLPRFVRIVPIFIAMALLPFLYIYTPTEELSWLEELGFVIGGLAVLYTLGRILLGIFAKHFKPTKKGTEKYFKRLQMGTASYVAFAHGANDVANSISPVLAIFLVVKRHAMPEDFSELTMPLWILLLGGIGMVLGISLLGHKVMSTLGNKITLLSYSKGFCVDLATATTVTSATIFGLPVSSTHAATGSIIGVGLAKKKHKLNYSILLKIVMTWIITVPTAALLTVVVFWILRTIFDLFI